MGCWVKLSRWGSPRLAPWRTGHFLGVGHVQRLSHTQDLPPGLPRSQGSYVEDLHSVLSQLWIHTPWFHTFLQPRLAPLISRMPTVMCAIRSLPQLTQSSCWQEAPATQGAPGGRVNADLSQWAGPGEGRECGLTSAKHAGWVTWQEP